VGTGRRGYVQGGYPPAKPGEVGEFESGQEKAGGE